MLSSFAIACERTASTTTAKRRRIAVARFELPLAVALPESMRLETPLLHDELIAAFVHTGAVDVVERSRLDAILKEQGLTRDAITDPGEAARLGRMLGADYFLIGTLTAAELTNGTEPVPYTRREERTLAGRIDVSFRLVEVETSRVAVAASAQARDVERGPEDPDRHDAWRALASRVADDVARQVLDAVAPITITKVDGNAVQLSRGAATGVYDGQRLQVLALAERDPLGRGPAIGTVQVTGADPNTATGQVTEHSDSIRSGMVCRPLPTPPPASPQVPGDPLEGRW
jgi:hypothetical protein